MNIVFFHSSKPREIELAYAFAEGARLHGHNVKPLSLGAAMPEEIELACMVGVKSLKLWKFFTKRGISVMMFDKGYSRHRLGRCWEYWRISLNGHHPTQTTLTGIDYPPDRFEDMGLDVSRWRKRGEHILIAGSSEKYHRFYGLPHPTEYAKSIIDVLQTHTKRDIIYRPKPSWRGAKPIKGSEYSHGKDSLAAILRDCHAIVTHGSNTCFEAALMGVPSVILGDAVMKPISTTSLRAIDQVKLGNRQPIFNGLAYHQWTLKEFKSGLAFNTIGEWL